MWFLIYFRLSWGYVFEKKVKLNGMSSIFLHDLKIFEWFLWFNGIKTYYNHQMVHTIVQLYTSCYIFTILFFLSQSNLSISNFNKSQSLILRVPPLFKNTQGVITMLLLSIFIAHHISRWKYQYQSPIKVWLVFYISILFE